MIRPSPSSLQFGFPIESPISPDLSPSPSPSRGPRGRKGLHFPDEGQDVTRGDGRHRLGG